VMLGKPTKRSGERDAFYAATPEHTVSLIDPVHGAASLLSTNRS